MKIGIFTFCSTNPMHPRTLALETVLKENGHHVEIFNFSENIPDHKKKINRLVFWYFDLYAVNLAKSKLKDFDTIIVQDMKYLPLVKHAKQLGKQVIYDTLDNNVELHYYRLSQKSPILRSLLFTKPLFAFIEKRMASKYTNSTIVNSKALRQYFNNKADVIYYSSPFENIGTENNHSFPPAILYLGAFTKEKGAHEILEISAKQQIPLHIFGDVHDTEIKSKIDRSQQIFHTKRISPKELESKLEALMKKYFLIGTSLIKPVHKSYATQEANKDIDYLAMGIPLIGNHRLPTEEKILEGCGVFHNDNIQIEKLIKDKEYSKQVSLRCKLYYSQNYSTAIFTEKLTKIIGQ